MTATERPFEPGERVIVEIDESYEPMHGEIGEVSRDWLTGETCLWLRLDLPPYLLWAPARRARREGG